MFGFIPQVLIQLLIFRESSVTKCVPLGNKLCVTRPTYSNLVKSNYYQLKVFNMLTRIHEAKNSVELISCNGTYLIKCNFDSTACNSDQQWNNESCQCECRGYQTCKKITLEMLKHVLL